MAILVVPHTVRYFNRSFDLCLIKLYHSKSRCYASVCVELIHTAHESIAYSWVLRGMYRFKQIESYRVRVTDELTVISVDVWYKLQRAQTSMGQSRQQYSAFSSSSVFRLTKLIFRLANYTHIHSELCSLFRRRPRCLPWEIHEHYYHCGTSNNVFILTGHTGSYVSNLFSRNGSASNLWRYRASGGWVIGDAHSPTSQCWCHFLYGEAVRSNHFGQRGTRIIISHSLVPNTRSVTRYICTSQYTIFTCAYYQLLVVSWDKTWPESPLCLPFVGHLIN